MDDNFDKTYVTIVRSGTYALWQHKSMKKGPQKLHLNAPRKGLNLPAWV